MNDRDLVQLDKSNAFLSAKSTRQKTLGVRRCISAGVFLNLLLENYKKLYGGYANIKRIYWSGEHDIKFAK